MKTCLIIRLSSFGDVLLTLPVLSYLSREEVPVKPVLVTKSQFLPWFAHLDGILVYGVKETRRFRGIGGLFRLARELISKFDPDIVIDLHQVIRTRILNNYFLLAGIPVYRIIKGRREKKRYLNRKEVKKLPHTVDRYIDTFRRAGIEIDPVVLPFHPFYKRVLPIKNEGRPYRIGFAPFARHKAKVWPMNQAAQLIERMSHELHAEIFLFGGIEDRSMASQLPDGKGIISLVGQNNPGAELLKIADLDIMITMDSGNMHLASLMGVPTISIWGGTHPDLGFRPYNQPDEYLIQAPDGTVECRPCSVFGNRPCTRKESPYECLTIIDSDRVYEKVRQILHK
ncbi:MAG: glycosyltransferase family 9 protein [Bacteroidales bacterium]|nr:glycosyltransferase family 9 protein [Bacteroidales bacterium]